MVFQSTHLHKTKIEAYADISILTSTQNVIWRALPSIHRGAISIHTSVQNATSAHQDRYNSRADFNPHIRTECNPNFLGFFPHNQDFNPRTRTECDGNNINDFRIPVYNV